mmetsp:Transcript_23125/g.53156  ORF Transcript_23125/g.53156 Transcript_23125/m.53156 type:complete len:214 (+) Transcript_23125:1046-1687(+)
MEKCMQESPTVPSASRAPPNNWSDCNRVGSEGNISICSGSHPQSERELLSNTLPGTSSTSASEMSSSMHSSRFIPVSSSPASSELGRSTSSEPRECMLSGIALASSASQTASDSACNGADASLPLLLQSDPPNSSGAVLGAHCSTSTCSTLSSASSSKVASIAVRVLATVPFALLPSSDSVSQNTSIVERRWHSSGMFAQPSSSSTSLPSIKS